MSLTVKCESDGIIEKIFNLVNVCKLDDELFALSAERPKPNQIILIWNSSFPSIYSPDKQNLEISRSFYRIFASFFRNNNMYEPVTIIFLMDDAITNSPASFLKAFARNCGLDIFIKDKYLKFGLGYNIMNVKFERVGKLTVELVVIHCFLLLLASVTRAHMVRQEIVKLEIISSQKRNLLDLGCGNGEFLVNSFKECSLERACGVETSLQKSREAARRCRYRKIKKGKLSFLNGRIETLDERFKIFDIVTLIEVIEHMHILKLPMLENSLFGTIHPDRVIITTPDRDFNEYLSMAGKFRHSEHFFEWSRLEFADWVSIICAKFGYSSEMMPVGGLLAPNGAAVRQLVVFSSLGN